MDGLTSVPGSGSGDARQFRQKRLNLLTLSPADHSMDSGWSMCLLLGRSLGQAVLLPLVKRDPLALAGVV